MRSIVHDRHFRLKWRDLSVGRRRRRMRHRIRPSQALRKSQTRRLLLRSSSRAQLLQVFLLIPRCRIYQGLGHNLHTALFGLFQNRDSENSSCERGDVGDTDHQMKQRDWLYDHAGADHWHRIGHERFILCH